MKYILSTIAFLILVASCNSKKTLPQPNVIVILVDDMGWGDIGYNNPGNVYTPNLDKLAAEGITFREHYTMPQCTPTRVAAFTGRYPGRFGTAGLQATNDTVFAKGTPTLATMFKAAGYRTYLSGKWHMGSSFEHGPDQFGFDESYGSLAGAVGMYDHRYREGKYENTWHRDLQLIEGGENGVHATDLVAKEAERIIEIRQDSPFFMYLAFHAPHTPLDERGAFVDVPTQLDPDNPDRWLNEDKISWFNDPEGIIQKEPDPEKRLLLAAVHHLDDAIGQVIQALEESGKRENTLILFSSDNGPQVNWPGNAYPDDLHLTDFNQPIPMRGSKLDVWEGGIHVPAIASWPGTLAPKTVSDPVHIIDWFPTLAGILEFQGTEGYDLDGVDIGQLLFENKPLQKRDLYWLWNKRTNRWALRYGDWKIVKYDTEEPDSPDDWQLYNLIDDPRESNDVSEDHKEIVADLHERFLGQRKKDKGENRTD
ncbi:sulfatase-like hydrolase/transferase [Fulvivirgaceae bacterium BMA12]|uniref:Sulfatase-like hydrolase/transferase n=1 Tax=Agaribacillus aureus TaxID=3051825 RepID=A0ABT8KZI5_9BACT|nr:sulfatase-like hydrolase/transferase [Fulvivirgaceae bacterium BMA12]